VAAVIGWVVLNPRDIFIIIYRGRQQRAFRDDGNAVREILKIVAALTPSVAALGRCLKWLFSAGAIHPAGPKPLSEWHVIRPEQSARMHQSARWRQYGHVVPTSPEGLIDCPRST